MDYNKIMIGGNIVRDFDVRYTPKGTAVCEMTIATKRRVKVNGEWEDKSVFVDVKAWGKTAENCGKYLSKGSKVFAEGELDLESWEDKQSKQKRSKLKVEASVVKFLDGGGNSPERPERSQQPQGGASRHQAIREDDDYEDDIPF